jgi:hypothetical protein
MLSIYACIADYKSQHSIYIRTKIKAELLLRYSNVRLYILQRNYYILIFTV